MHLADFLLRFSCLFSIPIHLVILIAAAEINLGLIDLFVFMISIHYFVICFIVRYLCFNVLITIFLAIVVRYFMSKFSLAIIVINTCFSDKHQLC